MYELSYDKGNLVYVKSVSNKTVNEKATSSLSCIDWYLITTIHYADGTTAQTEEYIGTTCTGCDCGDLQCLCPDDGSGGGNAGYYEYEEARACKGNFTYTPYYIYPADGGGRFDILQILYMKSHRVHFERDNITACYFVRSDIVGNNQGATSSVPSYQRTGIGTQTVNVTAIVSIKWPDQSTAQFTTNYAIALGNVGWNCN